MWGNSLGTCSKSFWKSLQMSLGPADIFTLCPNAKGSVFAKLSLLGRKEQTITPHSPGHNHLVKGRHNPSYQAAMKTTATSCSPWQRRGRADPAEDNGRTSPASLLEADFPNCPNIHCICAICRCAVQFCLKQLSVSSREINLPSVTLDIAHI